MSPYSKPAPRGFRWADTPAMRAALVILIVFSLGLSIYASTRYVALVDCLREHATADARRTKIIAEALDVERAADTALLRGPQPGGPDREQLRQAAISARLANDAARRANPAPSGESAICG